MCCGRKSGRSRPSIATTRHASSSARGVGFSPPPGRQRAPVYFQYVGRTSLSVLGPITGIRYRFGGHRAVLPVDPRDGPSLAAVPNLRRVGGPARPHS